MCFHTHVCLHAQQNDGCVRRGREPAGDWTDAARAPDREGHPGSSEPPGRGKKKTQKLSHSEREALNKTRKIVWGVCSKVNMAFGSSLCCTEFSRLRCYPQCWLQSSPALMFLSQVEIPNILKQRKQLAKLVLDYDSAKTRYVGHQVPSPSSVNFSGQWSKLF